MFWVAMLGTVNVLKAVGASSTGVHRMRGPHSITLLRHAMAGGAQAKPVLEYLTQLGGADDRLTEKPLTTEERTSLIGLYPFGPAASDRMEMSVSRDFLQISRPGHSARNVVHLGGFEFYPVGAENVRIRFERSGANVTMAIYDPDVVLKASRVAGA